MTAINPKTHKYRAISISFHSFVDVITNSSTTIYVRADESTIVAIKKFIDGILQKGGSTKTADDLFEFKIGFGEDEIECASDRYFEELEEKEGGEKVPAYSEQRKIFEELVAKGTIKVEDYYEEDCEFPQSNALTMIAKDDSKDSTEIISLLCSMFSIDGYRDG